MRLSAIPWALFGALMIFTPYDDKSWVNILWLGVTMTLYYIFSSIYLVPYFAMMTEIVTDTKRRVFFYTINTLVFVIGSAVIYVTPVIRNVLIAQGMSELHAWRWAFAIFGIIGAVFALIPAFFVRENDYVVEKPCYVPLLQSFKATFRYRNFSIFSIGYLLMWVAFSFFNASLMYYVTMLLGQNESFSVVVMGVAIVVGILSYPLVNGLTKVLGKKPLLLGACVAYVVIYTGIFFNQALLPLIGGRVFGILIGLLIGFPISITNILPLAAFADMAQYDTIKTGENRAGMFVAARNFTMQLSQSITLIVIPGVIALGSLNGKATYEGVRLTAIIAAVSIALALAVYSLYDDRGITKTIDDDNREKAAQESRQQETDAASDR
jgi:Na+/melibiose symporter and related transporters